MAIDDTVLDTFDGTGALSASWANAAGHPLYANPPTRSSGEFAKTGAGNYAVAYWTETPSSADCSVWMEFGTVGYAYLGIRAIDLDSGQATDSYELEIEGSSGGGAIYRITNDSYGQLGAFINGSGAYSAGQKAGLEVSGTTISYQRNNGSGWSTVGSRTDSGLSAAGKIYLIVNLTTTARSFGGGPFPVAVTGSAVHSRQIVTARRRRR